MKTIYDYTVVAAADQGALVDSVAELMAMGWQPLGGVCLAYERNIHRELGPGDINLPNDFQHFAQAMVKYADES